LDSSSIVLFVNRLMKEEGLSAFNIGNHQKTFTASYRNDPIDETLYAQEVIARTAVDGKFTFPDGINLWDELDTVLYFQDEPFGSTSIYAQWNVMRLARQHVKVVLDGQGGDELFGGYFFHSPAAIAQGNIKLFFQRLSLYKKSALQELFFALGCRFIPQRLKATVHRFFRRAHFEFLQRLFPQYSEYLSSSVKEIVKEVVTPNLNLRLWQDFTKYSIPHLLHYEDRNSMAFSVEARVPFLDYRFVDYVMNIPAIYKINHGWSKWIFRMAMQDVLPEKILWRKDKIGFSTPEKRWLLDGDNPFTSFMKRYQIPYDGNTFWWRLFITSYWMKLRGFT
jgi:asparagine synthase (glutamine-hydrolysing)